MIDAHYISWLRLVAALGCGLMAGLFFSFSAVIMRSLARQPQASGMAVMQTINVAILNPWFGAAFFGTPFACVLVIISSLLNWDGARAACSIAGSVLYLIGGLLVTVLFNIPKNNALEAVEATAPGAAALWSDYLTSWTRWNHVRSATTFAAAAFLTISV